MDVKPRGEKKRFEVVVIVVDGWWLTVNLLFSVINSAVVTKCKVMCYIAGNNASDFHMSENYNLLLITRMSSLT